MAIDSEGFVGASYHEAFAELAARYPAPSVLAVDIPIGLTCEPTRDADAARADPGSQTLDLVAP